MSGITISDVKIVGLCSKCRTVLDKIPKNKFGVVYDDKDIACVNCMLCNKEGEQE